MILIEKLYEHNLIKWLINYVNNECEFQIFYNFKFLKMIGTKYKHPKLKEIFYIFVKKMTLRHENESKS